MSDSTLQLLWKIKLCGSLQVWIKFIPLPTAAGRDLLKGLTGCWWRKVVLWFFWLNNLHEWLRFRIFVVRFLQKNFRILLFQKKVKNKFCGYEKGFYLCSPKRNRAIRWVQNLSRFIRFYDGFNISDISVSGCCKVLWQYKREVDVA